MFCIIFFFFPTEANENKGCSDLTRSFLSKTHLLIAPILVIVDETSKIPDVV